MPNLDGKVAFITGAGQGQGRAHAQRLAADGAAIIATDLCEETIHPAMNYRQADANDLAETKRLVEDAGGKIITAKADVRVRTELHAAVAAGIEAFGHIDTVVANAGVITFHSSSLEIPQEVYDLIVAVNQTGVWNTIQATAPKLIERKAPTSITITSSAAGIRGQIPYAHYAASKHAVVGMMKAFANELGRYGVRVNTIHPTGVRSPGMGADTNAAVLYDEEPFFRLDAMNVLPDFDNPVTGDINPVPNLECEEIANAVAFLASDEARYITGVQLPVDAGNTNKP